MYSLYQVIANATITGAKLGKQFTIDEFRSGVVGDPDFGIPVAKIKGMISITSVVFSVTTVVYSSLVPRKTGFSACNWEWPGGRG